MTNDRLVQAGRSILITGGLGDIGAATSLRLARDGHRVTLVDLPEESAALNRIAELAAGDDDYVLDRLSYCQADVTDSAELEHAIGSVPELHVAIANAGVVFSAPFLDISLDQWRKHLDVNLTGAFMTAQLTARRFVAEGTKGLLLFTGSWVADIPWPEIAAYSSTKAALQMVAKQAARELATFGIRANVVSPGIVRAGLAKIQLETEPQYAARAAQVIPLKELQSVEQVAAAFSFLCSPDSDYMTGSTLLVDGGASLYAFD